MVIETKNQIKMPINIIMYHYVRPLKHSRYPFIKGLDYNLFKQQIAFIAKNFNVITMEDAIASALALGGGLKPARSQRIGRF